MTKSQFVKSLMAQCPDLSRGQVETVLDALPKVLAEELALPEGKAVLPGIVRFKATTRPATPEREGLDPFTKTMRTFAAKPETKKIKATIVSPFKNALD